MDLSVVIVNYNTKRLLKDCLATVLSSQNITPEIIIVDNASKDGSGEMVKKQFPTVILIENQENRGFAVANNQGIKCAKGRYILLLNSDTEIEKDTLAKMVAFMDQRKDIAISGCQHLHPNGEIQPSAGYAPTWWRVLLWMFFIDDVLLLRSLVHSYHKLGPIFFQTEQEVDWLQGSFLFFRRSVSEKIGLFDEKIFLYGEDVEWNWRARRQGLRVTFTPITRIVHLGHGSSKENLWPGLLGELSAVQYMYRKFMGPIGWIGVSVVLWLGSVLRFAIFGILRGRKDARIAYGRFLTGRPMAG